MRSIRRSRWAAGGVIAVTIVAALVEAPVHAQPSVRVRSETRIELRTQRHEDHVVIEGALRDDLGEPLSDRPVVVRASPDDRAQPSTVRTLSTDDRGAFHLRLDLVRGGHLLRASFAGDEMHERVEVERRLDLDRADVRLRVGVPSAGHIDLDLPRHEIDVVADSDDGGGGLAIDLLDELDRLLASGRTDDRGRVSFDVSSSDLGPAGAGRIKARSRADVRRAEAQTEVPIVRFRSTEVTLEASRTSARPGEELRLSGSLRDSHGPIEGRAIGLFTRGEHLATVLTNREGAFVADIDIEATHEGTLEVTARYESDSPGRASSVSPEVSISVSRARPTPWPWLLVPLLICAGLLALIARRAPKRPEKSVEVPRERPIGIVAARRRTLRADRDEVSGMVLDHRDDEPVVGARVALIDPDGRIVREAVSDEHGAFSFRSVVAGTLTLSVRADAYAESRARVTVPHRGEWSEATVRLESLRSRALAPYRPVAAEILPSPRLWSIWTQREVLDEARSSGRATEELTELSDRVEEAYYGSTPPTDEIVRGIETRASETLDSLRSRK